MWIQILGNKHLLMHECMLLAAGGFQNGRLPLLVSTSSILLLLMMMQLMLCWRRCVYSILLLCLVGAVVGIGSILGVVGLEIGRQLHTADVINRRRTNSLMMRIIQIVVRIEIEFQIEGIRIVVRMFHGDGFAK